jgi:hypothetical protein
MLMKVDMENMDKIISLSGRLILRDGPQSQ